MIFNSLEFCLFFLVVYAAYVSFSHRWQNGLLLAASYFFYGWWDPRFLLLILVSTVVDYICGIRIQGTENSRQRRTWLVVSIASNLGILGFFKYYNFFAQNVSRVLEPVGLATDLSIVSIVLPVGISFYTFQTMSYTIDIYRKQLQPTRNFLNFAVFVAYFPQLVAGPIERARVLLPQIEQRRQIRYQQLREGFRLVLLGYLFKLVVADNMAPFTKNLFHSPESYRGLNVWFGLYAAAFQILGDFAGYSCIARGISKLMGIELMLNFRQPYFASSPSEFWARWHISLSTWLRDYLYIPLGGNRGGQYSIYRNLMLTMVIGGLWHGAALNFIAWGFFQGTILVLYRRFTPTIAPLASRLHLPPGLQRALAVIAFFHITCIGWLLFFAERLSHVKTLLVNLVNFDQPLNTRLISTVLFLGGLTLAIEALREFNQSRTGPTIRNRNLRLLSYAGAVAAIVLFGVFRSEEFIYFQF